MANAVRALADRLATILLDRNFKRSGSTSFTRRRGTSTDRVAIDKAGRVSLAITDRAVAALAEHWSAGGPLDENTFREIPELDITVPASATRLVTLITKELPFFDLAAAPAKLLAAAQRRYVPGFVAPTTIAPYLRVHLGPEAVGTYADGMLRGRPELWPAFVGKLGTSGGVQPDHGTELARMLATLAPSHTIAAPPRGTVTCTDLRAANLRAHFGLQLRAWGEPDAAGLLRRVDDAAIRALYSERTTVDDRDYAARVLHAATGEKRRPARTKPTPRYYQYQVLHGPWS
jgi:hypothetical protein